jgi:NAD(P)-dependent dehydrogenase (short-subunit alcohol dehydrogenase family)
MGKLDGQVAIVTGGSSGIGKSIALLYAKEGADVVIISRKEEALKEVCKLNPDKITYVAGDLTKTESIKKLVEYVKNKFGKLDILVNNAGWCPVQPLKELKIEDYDKAFNLDVRSLVNITIECLPLIIKSKGNIINISTVGATHRGPNLSMYLGAKAAVENFTRCWALELAKDGVRVNAIAPGAIETNIWNVTDLSPEEAKKHKESMESVIPCGRFGTPEEVANIALFLVSKEASYVNGSIYNVDGGAGAP